MTDSERMLILRNVSSPTSSGNGRSGTDRTGRASSASALMRKPRVGTSRLSMRSHSTLADRLPTVVPRRTLLMVSSGPATRISGSVWVVLRRL